MHTSLELQKVNLAKSTEEGSKIVSVQLLKQTRCASFCPSSFVCGKATACGTTKGLANVAKELLETCFTTDKAGVMLTHSSPRLEQPSSYTQSVTDQQRHFVFHLLIFTSFSGFGRNFALLASVASGYVQN